MTMSERMSSLDEQQIRESMRERIQTGMRALDRGEPGWEQYIDPDMLDLEEAQWCIVGQVQHGSNYMLHLLPDGDGRMYSPEFAFDLSIDEFDSGFSVKQLYSMLTEEWLMALRERAYRDHDARLKRSTEKVLARRWD